MNRIWVRRIAGILLPLFLAYTVFLPAAVSKDEAERVRVGFFAMDGYHMIDSQGRRSGYGYDYLQYMGRYTNFVYEYVGYDKSWDEMQDMLADGEIDLLTSARKTEERLEQFDFSDQPIGSSAAILTVKAGDSRYMVDDYSQLDGIRIGLLKGNSRNENLEQFARENGFTYQSVYYESSDELGQALQEGEKIDAILTSNLRKIEKEWIIATFDVTPFYIVVKKGNRPLLDKINRAIEELQREQKDLDLYLFERYYTADSGDEIAFTAEERGFIKDWQESGRSLQVMINSEREPVTYFVDGEARGIIPEIAREILRRSGLPYEFVETPSEADARELLAGGQADIRFDGISDFNEAEKYGLRVTDTYLELPVSRVTLKGFSGEPETAAVIRNSDVMEEYLERTYGGMDITRYDSAGQCLDSVLEGRKDAAFFQTYIAQRLVNEDFRNRIKEQLIPGYGMNFAVSVKREDTLLFSVLNKAVLSMGEEEINRIVAEQTSYLSRDMSLLGYLYAHPVLWLFMLAAAASFIIILILYLYRRKNLRLIREKAREFERFISHVCKANNSVIEVVPEKRVYWSYQVEDGKVVSRVSSLEDGLLEKRGIHPQDRSEVDEMTQPESLERLIAGGGEVYFECRIKSDKEAASYQWYACTMQGVPRDEINPGSLMIFLKNIDGAKREEEEKRQAVQDALTAAQQANVARGTFMSRMSHEIRTPLNAIIGYLKIAGANLQNQEKARECLKKSDFAAHQLLNIVNDVLDISAIESGRMKIAYETFNIRQLLSGITSIFRTQAEEKGVMFRVRICDLTEETLVGDQLRLNQILMNLLSNAVKFTMPGGQVTLTIMQKALSCRSIYLQFEVEDTGIGMSEDYKKRLFQPFEQQDASTARKFGGTGLGLSITKNLVNMMNGTIDMKSEMGKGTLFTVNLSFDVFQGQETMEDPYDFSRLRALVLYDEDSDYRYMGTLLERLGVQSDITLKEEEAICKIAEKKGSPEEYNLCLIDWDIPDGKGMEAAEKIRAAMPEGMVRLAVAYDLPELVDGGVVDGVILKPVFQSSLFDALSNICRRREEEEKQEHADTDLGLAGVRVLMAEDNELNMEIAREILEAEGMIIDCAGNGKEAAELFESSPEGTYKAVLMDIQMPVMNGYEAAERIRAAAHPQAGTIPIIALSADAFAEDINRALAAGMNGHVSKPVDFAKLCRVLSIYIAGQ